MTYPQEKKISVTVTPEKVLSKKDKNGKAYVAFAVGKVWYNCYEVAFWPSIQPGQSINIDYTGDSYKKVVAVHDDEPRESKEPIVVENGQAKGAAFNKAVDAAIAYSPVYGDNRKESIVELTKYFFEEFKKINQ